MASLTIGLVLVLALPGTAMAKGPESVTITGPDLDEPIEIALSGPGSAGHGAVPPYLTVALMTLADPFYVASAPNLPADPPPSTWPEPVTLTWRMAHAPSDADPAGWTVVQDVYYLGGGPRIYTHPGPYLDNKGGLYQAPRALGETIAALGAPVPGLPTGLPTETRTVVRQSSPSGAPTWSLPLAAAIGLASGVTLARVRPHRRRRPADVVMGAH